jgi:hypothetical protein
MIYFYKPSYLVQKSGDMLLHVTAGKLISPDNHGQIYWGVSTEYNTLRCYKVFNPTKLNFTSPLLLCVKAFNPNPCQSSVVLLAPH